LLPKRGVTRVPPLWAFALHTHTDHDYASAMLFGLTLSDSNATAAETASLQAAATSIKTKYGITDAQLNQFNIDNLTVKGSPAGTLDKLPTSGCNP
jgi:hypothetical protein